MEEEAKPSNDGFLGNVNPESKRELTVAATTATGTTTNVDQYACVDQTLYQMVRWLPPSSAEWFKSQDQMKGTDSYGTINDNSQQWSMTFASKQFNQIMLQSGDKSKKVILDM